MCIALWGADAARGLLTGQSSTVYLPPTTTEAARSLVASVANEVSIPTFQHFWGDTCPGVYQFEAPSS